MRHFFSGGMQPSDKLHIISESVQNTDYNPVGVESTTGAVEVMNSGITVAGGFRPYQCLNPSQLPVSNSRSSNRACRFPALGFQTKSCLRPRKIPRFRCKSSQTSLFIKSPIGKSHILSATHLTLSTQPLTKPISGVRIHRRIGGGNLTQTKVVRPPRQHLV